MLKPMDSPASAPFSSHSSRVVPGWALSRNSAASEADAAFAAGSALNTLDSLVRSEPVWGGCWRMRLALKCAIAATRLAGRAEDEAGLRDAVLLVVPGDDPGPAGRIFLAHKKLTGRIRTVNANLLAELADLLALKWNDPLAQAADYVEEASQSGRAVPFAAADLVTAICAERPDAEVLAWWLADWLVAEKLKWERPVPLLMGARHGSAFRVSGGKGRVHPGEEGFARAVCLALVDGVGDALRHANEIGRRAERLLAAAPKVRTKGAERVIRMLLEDDAVSAAAPGANLSRWASRRLFERLETLGAVRELSGRSTFRIFGL
ncbi:DUF1403 family protein [Rhizobium sp. ARZ01]|nr:DUF1403 family protein [Rhizobium sp. ARZ01]MBD9375010.1 DUF1403 family protein [Rhizobium sp. ARZ01]